MRHAAAIFLSAFLLFQVELIVGKFFLPWFGGTAAVWTTCMMFFQIMLLAGYAYAHALTVRLSRRNQGRAHAGLLLLSLALLAGLALRTGQPLLPPPAWRPLTAGLHPIPALLLLLTGTIGLPFFLLASTSPLLQRWFSDEHPQSPYRLYALSNLGSLLALCSYPFLVEPLLPLDLQARIWALLYGLAALLAAWCASAAAPSPTPTATAGAPPAAAAPEVPRGDLLLWMLLPACSTALLLAVTNELCQNIAAVPLLWMLPLTLYLLSFIFTFRGPGGYPRRPLLLAACVVSVVTLIVNFYGFLMTIRPQIICMNLLLFLMAMVCHGELVLRKPDPRRLTLFYLLIAAGGALGGIAVAIVAPLVFTDVWEFHGALILAWLVLFAALRRDRRSILHTGDAWHTYTLLLFLVLALLSPLYVTALADPSRRHASTGWLVLASAFALAGVLIRGIRRRPSLRAVAWPHLSIVTVLFFALLFLGVRLQVNRDQAVAAARNFYGVVRVQDQVRGGLPVRRLTHGRVVHGAQVLDPAWQRTPVAYYAPGGGLGVAWRHAQARRRAAGDGALRVGVTGLGTGVLAAWAQPGDHLRFYEIDPMVNAYAAAHFTYLRNCLGTAELAPCGDARLAMQQEYDAAGPQDFDLLVLDAFSGDSIPTHLLTVEAFTLYARHLRGPDALIVANISNRFLDLRPLLFSVAAELGWSAAWIPYGGEPPYATTSSWILLAPRHNLLDDPEIRARAQPYTPPRRILWTDNSSDVLSLLAARPEAMRGNRTRPVAATNP